MTCGEVIQFLIDYLEGELPAPVASRFKDHLERCPPCQTYLRTYQQTILTARRALCNEKPCGMERVPEEMIRAIMTACGGCCKERANQASTSGSGGAAGVAPTQSRASESR